MNRRLEFTEKGQPMRLVDRAIPATPPKGMVIKVKYCGICHSDILVWKTAPPGRGKPFELPRVLGHEVSGEVYSIGSDSVAGAPEFRVGQQVVLYPWGGCGSCPVCEDGDQNCAAREGPGARMHGIWCDGGFQEYVSVSDRKLVVPCPDGLHTRTAALLACGGLTAYNAMSTAKESLDRSIKQTGVARMLIIGGGGLGLWATMISKALYGDKIKVAVADASADKLPNATEAGADAVVCWQKDVKAYEAAQQVKKALGGGVDAVLDFVNIESTVQRGYSCCNYSATMVLVGMMMGKMPSIPTHAVAMKGLRIQGIFTGSLQQLRELNDLITQKKIAPPIKEVRLEEVQEAFQTLMDGKAKGRYVARL